jgi:hypothetical protein
LLPQTTPSQTTLDLEEHVKLISKIEANLAVLFLALQY